MVDELAETSSGSSVDTFSRHAGSSGLYNDSPSVISTRESTVTRDGSCFHVCFRCVCIFGLQGRFRVVQGVCSHRNCYEIILGFVRPKKRAKCKPFYSAHTLIYKAVINIS